jgi:hypothetical protein
MAELQQLWRATAATSTIALCSGVPRAAALSRLKQLQMQPRAIAAAARYSVLLLRAVAALASVSTLSLLRAATARVQLL